MPKTLATAEYEKNPLYLRPNETPQQYLTRTQGANAQTYQAPTSPTIPPVITSESLQSPASPVNISPYSEPPLPNSQQAAKSSEKMYQDLIAEQQRIAQQQEESAQSGVDSLLARLEGSITESGTVTKRTTEEETRLGVPDIQKNLREVTQQIIDINAADFAQEQKQQKRLRT